MNMIKSTLQLLKSLLKVTFYKYYIHKSNQMLVFLMRGENQSTRGKTSHGREENQQTQSSTEAGIESWFRGWNQCTNPTTLNYCRLLLMYKRNSEVEVQSHIQEKHGLN